MVFRFYKREWVKTVRDEVMCLNDVSDLKDVLQFLYDHRPEYEYPEQVFTCYLTSDEDMQDDLTLRQLNESCDVLGVAVLAITPIMDSISYNDMRSFPSGRFFYECCRRILYREV